MTPRVDKTVEEITTALGGAMPSDTVVSEVARRLLAYVTSGDIEPGTRLPPERQLAASLGVGRSAIREALAALDILGIVNVRPGSGTYLRGTASELLPETLSWGLMLSDDRTHDLIEIRQGLEVQAARLAVQRATPDHIERLRRCVATMRQTIPSLDGFVEADMAFHLELADASGNTVLKDLLQTVRALLRVWADRVVRDPADARFAVDEHEAVLVAIERRDEDAAAAAMSTHMTTAGERLLRAVGN
ncbi:MAG: FadR/GntR family transcriptional regulator [Ilumatobacteraceae bacterium]|nr:FadR/GntR family transcriptional regulator [Ilumatobacteraceae bacterium]